MKWLVEIEDNYPPIQLIGDEKAYLLESYCIQTGRAVYKVVSIASSSTQGNVPASMTPPLEEPL